MAIPSSLSLVQLHSGQMKVFKSPHRFKVVCAGRRWGKSRLSISKIIKAAAADRKQRVWYVAPTYQMARMATTTSWPTAQSAIRAASVWSVR